MTSREAFAIAQRFHDEYERLAPHYRWHTQVASRVPWGDLPDNQRRLMCAVVENLLAEGTIRDGLSRSDVADESPQPSDSLDVAERGVQWTT